MGKSKKREVKVLLTEEQLAKLQSIADQEHRSLRSMATVFVIRCIGESES